MKKLLSLLSVLTISGTAVPTTIAANPYQKEENKLENIKINYQQTNNLENLKRNKRHNNNLFAVSENNRLRVNITNCNSFKESYNNVFHSLINDSNILKIIFQNSPGPSTSENNEIVLLNTDSQYKGFIVPVTIEENSESKKIELVFRTENLYLDGFIVGDNYYHFKKTDRGPSSRVIDFVKNKNSVSLGISGGYGDLFVNENGNWININIDWNRIFSSFDSISNYQGTLTTDIRNSLGVIAVVVAENWRFRKINNEINNKVIKNNQSIIFGKGEQTKENLYKIAMDWNQQGSSILRLAWERWDYGIQSQPYSNYFDENHQPIRVTNVNNRDTWGNWFYEQVLPYTPINVFSDEIYNSHTLRILFLIAVNYITNSCHHGSNQKREINDNLNQEFCNLQSSVSKIKGNITLIQILNENTKGGDRHVGDAYIGTTEGLYLIHNDTGNVSVYSDLKFSIVDIKIDKNKGVYILTNTGKVYFISNNDEERPIEINSLNNKFITSIGILENDSPVNSALKSGTLYFGTTEGVYFSYDRRTNNNAVSKIEGLNEEIALITVDNNGSAHILTKTGKSYVVGYDSWNALEENISTNQDGCSFKKYVINHVWSWNWKNLIPGYGLYHVFTCSA